MDSYLKKFLDDNGYSKDAVIYGVDMSQELIECIRRARQELIFHRRQLMI